MKLADSLRSGGGEVGRCDRQERLAVFEVAQTNKLLDVRRSAGVAAVGQRGVQSAEKRSPAHHPEPPPIHESNAACIPAAGSFTPISALTPAQQLRPDDLQPPLRRDDQRQPSGSRLRR